MLQGVDGYQGSLAGGWVDIRAKSLGRNNNIFSRSNLDIEKHQGNQVLAKKVLGVRGAQGSKSF